LYDNNNNNNNNSARVGKLYGRQATSDPLTHLNWPTMTSWHSTANSLWTPSYVVHKYFTHLLFQASYLHLCASVTKQYNLVWAKGQRGNLSLWLGK